MAAPAVKKGGKVIDLWKRKKWYNLVAPAVFGEAFLGETPAAEEKDIMGRTAKVNLMVVTNDMKKQHVNLTFEVVNVQGDKAFTEVIAYEVVPAFIKRMVRRAKDRIDDSFLCETSDHKVVRIKPFLLASGQTSNRIRTLVRKLGRDFLFKNIAQTTYDELVDALVGNKVQMDLKAIVSKIYPVRSCEIRTMKLEKGIAKAPPIESVNLPVEEEEETVEEQNQIKSESAEEIKAE